MDSVTRKVVKLWPWGDGLDPNYRPHLVFTFFWSAVKLLQFFNCLLSRCKTCLITFSNCCVQQANFACCCCSQLAVSWLFIFRYTWSDTPGSLSGGSCSRKFIIQLKVDVRNVSDFLSFNFLIAPDIVSELCFCDYGSEEQSPVLMRQNAWVFWSGSWIRHFFCIYFFRIFSALIYRWKCANKKITSTRFFFCRC